MKKANMIIIALIVLSFALGAYFYPQMPDQMASHWNSRGEVDGHMSKFSGLFMMPLISVGLLLMFIAVPKIDPLKANIKKFQNYFDTFVTMIIIFLFYIYILSLVWNLNYTFDLSKTMLPALAILFFFIGNILKHTKRNWFIGIRTPWTLSSDKVWERTHQKGSFLFKLMALVFLAGAFVSSEFTIWFILVPVLAGVVYLFAYSYFEYQKETKNIM